MSIAEKLLAIAKNEPKVFEAGKTGEEKNITPPIINEKTPFRELLQTIADNIIKVYKAGLELANKVYETVSGAIIRVDNVSSVEHNLDVNLTSDTITDFSDITVYRYGKNLIPYPYEHTTRTINGITFTDNGDGTITANGTATADAYFFLCGNINPPWDNVTIGKVTISGCPKGGGENSFYISSVYTGHKISGTFTLNTKIIWLRFRLVIVAGTTVDNIVFKPQVEFGDMATDFEVGRQQTVMASADGTVDGLTSVSPNMTLFTNSENVIINCKYLKE